MQGICLIDRNVTSHEFMWEWKVGVGYHYTFLAAAIQTHHKLINNWYANFTPQRECFPPTLGVGSGVVLEPFDDVRRCGG